MEIVAAAFQAGAVKYAVTALGAAWLHAPMARFRKLHVYVRGRPEDRLLRDMGFREREEGANLRMIVGPEEAVWEGTSEIDGTMCVSALQAYLDLKKGPERSAEAAQRLREQHPRWTHP